MKLEEIIKNWSEDSNIDPTELGDASLDTAKLHAKYYELYLLEKMRLLQLTKEFDELHLQKKEFYLYGNTPESIEKGWELPPKGCVIKSEADYYVDHDPDIIELNLKRELQKEKVNYILSIINHIDYNRRHSIGNAIEWLRFTQGG